MKKLFALLLAVAASVTMLHATVHSGTCGDDVRWEYNDENGKLYIAGTGEMDDMDRYAYERPWWDYFDDIVEVTIYDGVTSVGKYAFDGNPKLKEVTLPNTIKQIGAYAFNGCEKLTTIHFSNALTYIGENAFEDCEKLTTVDLPNGVDTIKYGAFKNTHIHSIEFPNSLTYLEDYAFADCTNLTEVVFNSQLKEIPDNCFDGCTSLNNVKVPNNIVRIGVSAFESCSSLSSISLSKNIESIDNRAFDYTPLEAASENWDNNIFYLGTYLIKTKENISGVVDYIKTSTTVIADNAFDNTQITQVKIPKNVKYIGEWAFAQCPNLTKVTGGSNVQKIGHCAFISDEALKSISFPNSLIEIDGAAFQGCEALQSISFGTALKSIGERAFEGCNALKELVIPDNVEHVGSMAFASCERLTKVTIGKGVREIGGAFFSYNDNIKEIVWNAIELDEEYMYYTNNLGFLFNDNEIEKITIGEEVKALPARFISSGALKELTIPASVQKIDYQCFYGNNIKTVTCEGSTPATLEDYAGVSFAIADNAVLHVPCGSLKAYKKSDWNNYFSKFEEYFPYEVIVKSEDESMGVAVLGDLNCTEGSVQIEAQPKTGFVFVGWSDGSTEASRTIQVTQDTTLVATFKVQTFLIQFVDWNGSLIQQADVEYNTLPDKPQEPVRKPNAQYTYTFKGWKPEVAVALEDVVYKANYDSVVNTYTITFLNEDNSTLSSKKWAYGEIPYCKEPTKESSAEFVYHFNGWNPAIESVTGEATYKATFRAVPFHTLVFLDWNGDLIEVVKVEEGMPAVAPADPKRTGYTFSGWSRDLSSVMENQYVIALYEAVTSGIEVIFKNPNDQILSKQSADLVLPVIPDSEQPHFLGWKVEQGDLSDGIVIRANYDSTPTGVPAANTQTESLTSKIFSNGTIYILRGDKVYTVTGQTLK